MEIRIQKVWGKVRQDRWGVVVDIENNGQNFVWLPTYEHLADLIKKMGEVETLNQKEMVRQAILQATSSGNGCLIKQNGGNTTTTTIDR